MIEIQACKLTNLFHQIIGPAYEVIELKFKNAIIKKTSELW